MVAAEERAEFFFGLTGVGNTDGFVGFNDFSHLVVDFEDDSLGAVLAVLGFILAADNREGVHDVVDGISRRWEHLKKRLIDAIALVFVIRKPPFALRSKIKMEVSGIEFAANLSSTSFVPDKGRGVVAAINRKGS